MADSGDDEQTLVTRARGGDREAWASLCRLSAPRLAAYLGARLARQAVVEKLVGDAIVAAWRKLPELQEPAEFQSWLRRIGANLAMRWRSDHPDEALLEPFPADRCADQDQVERMRRLSEAMARLPEAERIALEQRFRGRLEGSALGTALHLEPAAVPAVIERALASLDRELRP